MSNISLDDCIFLCMRNNEWWTFWDLQKVIKQNTGKFYGEPTISAGIRNMRKPPAIKKYKLPQDKEVIIKKRIAGGKGYKYRLITE